MVHSAAADRYDRMAYRRCGHSGLKLPVISLGLWQNFGDATALEIQRAIVRRAFDRGVTHLDLARSCQSQRARAARLPLDCAMSHAGGRRPPCLGPR